MPSLLVIKLHFLAGAFLYFISGADTVTCRNCRYLNGEKPPPHAIEGGTMTGDLMEKGELRVAASGGFQNRREQARGAFVQSIQIYQ